MNLGNSGDVGPHKPCCLLQRGQASAAILHCKYLGLAIIRFLPLIQDLNELVLTLFTPSNHITKYVITVV